MVLHFNCTENKWSTLVTIETSQFLKEEHDLNYNNVGRNVSYLRIANIFTVTNSPSQILKYFKLSKTKFKLVSDRVIKERHIEEFWDSFDTDTQYLNVHQGLIQIIFDCPSPHTNTLPLTHPLWCNTRSTPYPSITKTNASLLTLSMRVD